MKVEFGVLALAFFAGMVTHDQMSADEVVWVDYGEDPMANPEFMQDMMAAGTPGEEHGKLAASAGTWKVDANMWMDPEGAPIESVGKAERRMILGDRYLVEEYESSFMGMPYHGMLIAGYDNLKQEHFSIWLDSFSTAPSMSRGKKNEAGVLEQTGIMHDVMTPGGRPYRSTIGGMEGDQTTFEMFDTRPGGGEFKVMEMTYSREKAEK